MLNKIITSVFNQVQRTKKKRKEIKKSFILLSPTSGQLISFKLGIVARFLILVAV